MEAALKVVERKLETMTGMAEVNISKVLGHIRITTLTSVKAQRGVVRGVVVYADGHRNSRDSGIVGTCFGIAGMLSPLGQRSPGLRETHRREQRQVFLTRENQPGGLPS